MWINSLNSKFLPVKVPSLVIFYLSTVCLIPDKPICSVDQKKIYGVARGEVVSINCSVSANPGQDLVFRWTFNNTSELASIQSTRFTQNGTISRLIYSPYHELDYGTILCWAANNLGEQEDPCTFHIIPAGNNATRRPKVLSNSPPTCKPN